MRILFQKILQRILGRPALAAFVSLLALSSLALAGSLTPPGSPASTMNTLEELFDSIAGTFDSSAVVSDQDGSLIQHLKYIEENMGGGVGSDSLDFDEFVDNMTLDANTSIASAGFVLTTQADVGVGISTLPREALEVGGFIRTATSSWEFSADLGATRNIIGAITEYNGKLYVATGAGAGDASVWVYDGANWSLSSDFGGGYSYIATMAVFGGRLYAGASVTGGSDIYVFDGTSWTLSLDGFAIDDFRAMTVYNGKLYVGAGYDLFDHHIASFDGTTWRFEFHDGVSGTAYGAFSMAVYNGKLFAGLCCSTAKITMHDGTNFFPNTHTFSGYESVNALATFNGRLYAGLGNDAGDGDIWVYDGVSWVLSGDLGVGASGVQHFAAYNGNFYAAVTGGAAAGVYKFNGTSWSLVLAPTAPAGGFYRVGVSVGKLFAGTTGSDGAADVYAIHDRLETQLFKEFRPDALGIGEGPLHIVRTLTTLGNLGVASSSPFTRFALVGSAGNYDLLNIASSTGTSLLRMKKSGNIGIGTLNPLTKIHIVDSTTNGDVGVYSVATGTGSTTQAVLLAGTATSGINYGYLGYQGTGWADTPVFVKNATTLFGGGNGGLAIVEARASASMRFFAGTDTTTAERMRISGSTGNIGINDTNPGFKLSVNGTASISGHLNLGSGCTGCIGSNSLDFDEFRNAMTLDAITTIASAGFSLGIDTQGYTPTAALSIGRNPISQGFMTGTTAAKLSVVRRVTAIGAPFVNMLVQSVWDFPAAGTGIANVTIANQTASSSAQNMTGVLTALTGVGEHVGTGTATEVRGIVAQGSNRNIGAVTTLKGLQAAIATFGGAGTTTNAYAVHAAPVSITTGTVSNMYNLYSGRTTTGGGTIISEAGIASEHLTFATNNTELLIASTSSGLNIPAGNWGIYNGSPYTNYFASNLGIGTKNIDTTLEVAGTASISGITKFFSGASMSGNFDPGADNTFDLGAVGNRWRNIFATNASISSNLEVSGTASVSQLYVGGTVFNPAVAGGWTDGGSNVYLTTGTDNVGIASISPVEKFSVEGTARITGHISLGNIGGVDQFAYSDSYSDTTPSVIVINEEFTDLSAPYYSAGISSNIILNPSLDAAGEVYSVANTLHTEDGNAQDFIGVYGTLDYITHAGTGVIGTAIGTRGEVSNDSTGTITNSYGGKFTVNAGSGTSTNMYGAAMHVFVGGTAAVTNAYSAQTNLYTDSVTVTNAYGLQVRSPALFVGGNLINGYGIYVENQSIAGVTNPYNIYSAGAASRNQFEGHVSVSGNFELTGFVASSLTPRITNTFDLGTSALRWRNIYATNASISNNLEVSNIASFSQLFVGGTAITGGVGSDSLDFDEFVDNMTLDDSTSIASSGNDLEISADTAFRERLAIGSIADYGDLFDIPGQQTLVSLHEEFTDLSVGTALFTAGTAHHYELNPSATADTISIWGQDVYMTIPDTNTEDFTSTIVGGRFYPAQFGSGTVTNMQGLQVQTQTNNGTVIDLRGILVSNNITGTGEASTSMGIEIQNPLGVGSIESNYGLFVQDQSGASSESYNIFSAGAGGVRVEGHSGLGNAGDVDRSILNDLQGFGFTDSAVLAINERLTASPTDYYSGISNDLELDLAADDALTFYTGAFNNVYTPYGNTSDVISITGAQNSANMYGDGDALQVIGAANLGGNWGDGTTAFAYGSFNNACNCVENGNIGDAYGTYSSVHSSATGVITNAYDFYAELQNGTGTITNNYGLYVAPQNGLGVVNGYSIFSAGAGTRNIFEGHASVGGNFELTGLVASNLTPRTTDTYDLGSSTLRWRDLYLASGSLHIGTSGDEAVIDYNVNDDYLSFKPDGSTTKMTLTDAGRASIGGTPVNPLFATLHVVGNESATLFATNPGILAIHNQNTSSVSLNSLTFNNANDFGGAQIAYIPTGGATSNIGGILLLSTKSTTGNTWSPAMRLENGNVGIGANFLGDHPDQRLDVTGNITASTSGNVDFILNSNSSDDARFTIRSAGTNDRLEILSSASTNLFTITEVGNVGIASISPLTTLSVEGTTRLSGHVGAGTHGGVNRSLFYGGDISTGLAVNEVVDTVTTGSVVGISSDLEIDLSGASAAFWAGVSNVVNIATGHTGALNSVSGAENYLFNNSNASVSFMTGTTGHVEVFGTGTANIITGSHGTARQAGSGTIGELLGGFFAGQTFDGHINNLYGISAGAFVDVGATASNAYGIFVDAPSGGTTTNRYGLFMENQTDGGVTNGWNIYSDGATSRNYFGGRLGIGTTAPTQELHISSASDGDLLRLVDSDGDCTVNPEAVTTFSCSSDRRLKDDIEDTQPILARIMDFRVRDFTMRSSGDPQTGVIAQEVQETWPDMVSMGASGYLKVEQPNPWLVIKAIQELNGKIEDLGTQGPLHLDQPSLTEEFFAAIIAKFKELLGIEFQEKTICLGETCINEEKLKQLLEEDTINIEDDEGGEPEESEVPTPSDEPQATPESTPEPEINGSNDEPLSEEAPEEEEIPAEDPEPAPEAPEDTP